MSARAVTDRAYNLLELPLSLDAIQNAVNELRGLLRAVSARDLDRFVDDDRAGSFGIEQQFLCRQPQDVPIDNGHPVQPPVFGMALNHGIDLFYMLNGLRHKSPGKLDDGRLLFMVLPERRGDRFDRVVRNIPLE